MPSFNNAAFGISDEVKYVLYLGGHGQRLADFLKAFFAQLAALVKQPIEAASLFVPKAYGTGNPRLNRAGVEIKPPPPTVESINEAIKPDTIRKITVVVSKFATKVSKKFPSFQWLVISC